MQFSPDPRSPTLFEARGPLPRGGSSARVERQRQLGTTAALDRAGAMSPPTVAARRLVQVYDGGAMPTAADKVYLTHPVELDGSEVEGGTATPNVDTSVSIPVVFLSTPAVGDLVVATAVGGRWVAREGSTPTGYPCGTCRIPQKNLTVSWVNPGIGNGSAPLVYSAPNQWASGCANNLLFKLLCTSNQIELRVYYFIAGPCPTGQSQYCSNIRTNPFGLQQTLLTCNPFVLTCTVTSSSCSSLALSGYTSFTVTQ